MRKLFLNLMDWELPDEMDSLHSFLASFDIKPRVILAADADWFRSLCDENMDALVGNHVHDVFFRRASESGGAEATSHSTVVGGAWSWCSGGRDATRSLDHYMPDSDGL